MYGNKLKNSSIGMTMIACIAMASFAHGEEKPANANIGLKELNERISNLSLEIMRQQRDLAAEVEKLLNQRQSLVQMEKKLSTTLTEQEGKLFTQKLAIEEAERQLDREKLAYQDQNKRLDELRASLRSSQEMNASLAGNPAVDRK